MKKNYIMPALSIEKFTVEDILTASVTNVLESGITDDEIVGAIKFDDGNTLQAIDYTQFFK